MDCCDVDPNSNWLENVDVCRSTAAIIHGYVDHLACCYIENFIRDLYIYHFLF